MRAWIPIDVKKKLFFCLKAKVWSVSLIIGQISIIHEKQKLVKQMLLKKFSEKYNLEMEKEKELKKSSSFNIYWLWTEFKFLNIVFKCCNYSTDYFGSIFSVNLIEAEKRWKTLLLWKQRSLKILVRLVKDLGQRRERINFVVHQTSISNKIKHIIYNNIEIYKIKHNKWNATKRHKI